MKKGGAIPGQDVVIHAPPAVWPPPKAAKLTPEDELVFLQGELRRTEVELQKQTIAAESLANISICLVKAIQDKMGAAWDVEVMIPHEIYEKTRGSEIHIRGNADGDLFLSYTDRALHPVTEGRH